MLRFKESSYAQFVQRLFAMFPQGGPGVALLLLRISVAAAFLSSLANRWDVFSGPLRFAGISVICLICVSLSVGFLTPFLSVIVCAATIANLLINTSNLIHFFTIFDAAALALLGPGAYSVDARLFGRRVTVVSTGKARSRSE